MAASQRRIAIIGTGFSGLCLGIQLKKAGIDSFVIYEKAEGIGGTWRENTYPGAECDIPSALYSFSFEKNPNWSHKWSEQPEILEYLEYCAKKHDLYSHMEFGQRVSALHFDEEKGNWRLQTEQGVDEEFDLVVSGIGQLHKPALPAIEGIDDFQGDSFHSAQWNHDVSLEGKKVSCIGNGASAVQFLPQIAPSVSKLTVFQRSANWVLPKKDRPYSNFEKKIMTLIPPLLGLYRFGIWLGGEVLVYPLMYMKSDSLRKKAEQGTKDYIESKIDEPAVREKLLPDYPMGAKRILFSDDIYDAYNRDNVKIVTDSIEKIEARGVRTKDGTLHETDVLVYASGFETNSFVTPMEVTGLGGSSLTEIWDRDGAEAYLGITHTGFPNFFMMYGPNTNLGHSSIVVMIEAQTRYILSCLAQLDKKNSPWLNVKQDVQKRYNDAIQEKLQKSSWANVDQSWYKNEQGKVTNNWSGRTTEYRKLTKHVNPDDYEFAGAT